MLDLGCSQRLGGVATRLLRLRDLESLVALRIEVGREGVSFVLDLHERRGEARSLPILGENERNWLLAEMDLVVVERTERRAFIGRDTVLVGLVSGGHARSVLMRQHVKHAGNAECSADIEALDSSLRDRRRNDRGKGEVGNVKFGGIFCSAGDLGGAVDAGDGGAEIEGHKFARLIARLKCGGGLTRWSYWIAIAACDLRPASSCERWHDVRVRS
jgi:hypothetical protein